MNIKKYLKDFFNDETKSHLSKNYALLTILQGANFIIPLIILPYLVRTLGAETFGLVMFAQAFIIYFNVIVDFGFSLSGVREVSVHRDNKQKLEEIFNSIMTIKIFLIIISFILLYFIVDNVEKFSAERSLYFITFGYVIGQAILPLWFFQGVEKMKYITILKISAQLISMVAIVLFVRSKADYLYVPLLSAAGFVIAGIVSIYIIARDFQFKFYIPRFEIIKRDFKESSHFFLSRVAVSIYTSSNAFVLGIFTNNIFVGYYSIAEKLYIALQALYMPITQVLYPYVAKERNIHLFKQIFKYVVAFNTIMISVLYLISPFLIYLIAGEMIDESNIVFRTFLLVAIIVVPSILIGYPFLAALGHKKYANYSVVAAAVFHLSGLFILSGLNMISIYTIVQLLIFTQLIDLSIRIFGIYKNNLWSNN